MSIKKRKIIVAKEILKKETNEFAPNSPDTSFALSQSKSFFIIMLFSNGGGSRTLDLQVMSLASYHC